jgi:hypothetical protein
MIILPSLEIVPAKYNTSTNTLLSQIPIDGTGDFTVSRTTSPVTGQSTRVNALGQIELVADNVPRLDYPIGGGCPALLVEPSGTNGILNSTDTTTNWTLGPNLTRGAIDVIGVSGTNLTVAVSGSGINLAAGRIARSGNNVALASGSTYTISFFVKKTGTHTIGGYYALITGAASGNLGAGFDVSGSFSSGSIFDTAGTTNRIRRVEQWGTDVFRCSETFTMTASGTLTSFFLAPVAGVTSSSNPTAGSQLGFAAPQIELGSVPTSFIPTTTGSVTRSADIIRKTGITSLIGQSEGTVYFEVEVTDEARNKWFCSIDSVAGSFIQMYITPTRTIAVQIQNSSSVVMAQLTSSALTVGYHKIAFAYNTATNGCIMYIDGVQNPVATRTVVAPGLPAFSNMSFGTYFSTTSDTLKAHVRAGAVYPNRLSDTELAALTTL